MRGIIGTLLNLDGALNRLGQRIEKRFVKDGSESTFAKGFITASLLFCVGAMVFKKLKVHFADVL